MIVPRIPDNLSPASLVCLLVLVVLQGCESATVKPMAGNTQSVATSGQPATTKSTSAGNQQSVEQQSVKQQSVKQQSVKQQSVTKQSVNKQPVKPQPAVNNTEIHTKTTPLTTAKTTQPPVKPAATSAAAAATAARQPAPLAKSNPSATASKSTTTTIPAAKQQVARAAGTVTNSATTADKEPVTADTLPAVATPNNLNAATSTAVSKPVAVRQTKTKANTAEVSDADQVAVKPSAETQLALAEPPALQGGQSGITEATAAKKSALKLTADMLPHTFGNWTLERNWDNQHPQTCRLRSAQTTINDGYEATYLWAEILPDEINIYTGSNIDLSYTGSGLQFGNRPVQAFSGFLTETAVNIAGDYRKLLADSSALTVYLGFWPTWPKTEVKKVALPAQQLWQALPVFEACQTWSE